MFGPGVTSGFQVAPRSIAEIRRASMHARRVLLPKAPAFFPMAPLIEHLHSYSIVYDVVEAAELPSGVEACCVPEAARIMIENNVYLRACRDEPRSRFTIIHELGHLLLGHSRTFNRDSRIVPKAFEDSEWQANRFAAEFLMPYAMLKTMASLTPEALMVAFQVSAQAAEIRLDQLSRRGEI